MDFFSSSYQAGQGLKPQGRPYISWDSCGNAERGKYGNCIEVCSIWVEVHDSIDGQGTNVLRKLYHERYDFLQMEFYPFYMLAEMAE